ncbi:ArsR/SmtB family transcription factor [Clostridium manihotivorum]|uniref:ArsR family transcriptional regulator n=1 Tax=Clostridium manihotivorum TaxID=2320868 RepID=A0A3R5QUQ3_9CLOT|nr:metalloregulator ArsR/SmtB family transcription factor [Clostridium manihotivorum]QAA32782.1 ArsR family transcriptional regulator [Clostridium manihotivorum]
MNFDDLTINIIKALGHPVRYKIIKFLYESPKCVCKLNEEFQFSQANLSQHLRILKDASVLKSEKVGVETHYSLYSEEIKNIINAVENYVGIVIENAKR